MKTENQNFTKHYDLIPEDHIIIGWGYPEPDMDFDGNMRSIPCFELTDAYQEGDVSADELSWLSGIVGQDASRCNHCGKAMKYFALVKNMETSRAHIIGTQCASSMIGYRQEKVDAMHKLTLKARQKINRVQKVRKAKAQAQAFLDDHAGLEKALAVNNHISKDLLQRCRQHGKLSDAQIELAFKLEKQVAERAAQAAERAAQGASSQHIGKIGERIRSMKCIAVMQRSFDTDYGTMYIVKFITAAGCSLTYKGSNSFSRADQYECELTFTVKDHSEYKGEKQTVISRIIEHHSEESLAQHRLKTERESLKY